MTFKQLIIKVYRLCLDISINTLFNILPYIHRIIKNYSIINYYCKPPSKKFLCALLYAAVIFSRTPPQKKIEGMPLDTQIQFLSYLI